MFYYLLNLRLQNLFWTLCTRWHKRAVTFEKTQNQLRTNITFDRVSKNLPSKRSLEVVNMVNGESSAVIKIKSEVGERRLFEALFKADQVSLKFSIHVLIAFFQVTVQCRWNSLISPSKWSPVKRLYSKITFHQSTWLDWLGLRVLPFISDFLENILLPQYCCFIHHSTLNNNQTILNLLCQMARRKSLNQYAIIRHAAATMHFKSFQFFFFFFVTLYNNIIIKLFNFFFFFYCKNGIAASHIWWEI